MEKKSMRISLHDLEKTTKQFSKELKIGSGGFAKVYKGVYDSKEIAVKLLDDDLRLEDNEFEKEFANLMRINDHPNIVRLVGYCYETRGEDVEHEGRLRFRHRTYRILCFEYMQRGSLDKYLKESRDHDWRTRYKIIKGICEGLNFLHQTPIYHLDLKPANILLDKSMVPKIADFGLSELFKGTRTYTAKICAGTDLYMPPEFFKNRKVSAKYDVYSLGITILQIMDGHTEYSEADDVKQVIGLVNTKWRKRINATTSPYLSAERDQVETCIEMAIKCTDKDRENRPTVAEVMHTLKETEKKFPVEWWPPDVVIVYAFDCTTSTPAWYKMDEVFWVVQEKLTHFADSCLGYTYVMSTPNTYTSEMKLVDSAEIKANDYTKSSAWSRTACTKNMASGLSVAHKLIGYRGHWNGIILLFSDGLINKGDFFDGAKDFVSTVPVHTFTLGGDAYNDCLRVMADNSPGGIFSPLPIPDKPSLSVPFSRLLDSILSGTTKYDEKHPNPDPEWWPLDVVLVYSFDCTTSTPAWYKLDEIFWLVQEKLTHFADSCLGYTYVMSTPNTCTSEMKLVDSAEIKANDYTKSSAWSRTACTKNMASGLSEAHKLIGYRGHWNGIILLFSDGLINEGDFFDGAKDFDSRVPVHTFTLGGDAYNDCLRVMADNSPGGIFSPLPIPDKPSLSVPFSRLLDSILSGTTKYDEKHPSPDPEWWPLDVVLVYSFDCTTSTPAWYKLDEIFWLVQEKLTDFADSCLGYTYVMSTPNTCTSEMKLVDSAEIKANDYTKSSAWSRTACTKNMASGLSVAHKLIGYRGHWNGIILLFSDGLINKGDFFDGAKDFDSRVPVHTFTLGGDAYNDVLRAMAANSPGGTFNPLPVSDQPMLAFSQLLDGILSRTVKAS